MPKMAKPLTAVEVKRLTEQGVHAVGAVAGLNLVVKPSGARARAARPTIGNRRAELGLGAYPTVTLADACEAGWATIRKIKDGTDPAADKRIRRNAGCRNL